MVSLPKRRSQPAPVPAPSPAPVEQWSPPLQTILDQPPSALPLQLAIGGMIFCGVFSAWAWFGQIDEVATATGKLIPKDETFKVHPIELGKVARVAVSEGQSVKAGQVLLELETEIAANEVERIENLLFSSQTERVQVQGLLDQMHLQRQTQAAIAQAEIRAQEVAIGQAELTIANQQTLLTQLQEDADAQETRLARLQPLSQEGAIPRERLFEAEQSLRNRERSLTESQGSLQRAQTETERLRAEMSEKQAKAAQLQLEAEQQKQQLAVRLTGLQAKIADTETLLQTAKAKLNQRYLYAPVDGTVLSLNVRQSGEVVQPGQTIAELAPQGKPLVLSAILPSREAGFVKPGLTVQVKLDAYPFQDYGVIPGRVISISPDSKLHEKLGSVYRVEVELSRGSIYSHGANISFKPGQTATAEIVTRQRRIADILLDPIRQLQGGVSL
jgi:HlyD family type I secretion membrane fusion protein